MKIKYPEKVKLARLPTPLEKPENLNRRTGGPEIYIKRDDLTGCATSGNKIRKLEFAIADAKKKGADTLITCGWLNSNHCRATSIASRKAGLRAILLLRGEKPEHYRGNLFLDFISGADIRFLTPEEYERRDEIMEDVQKELLEEGRKGYPIPAGATFPPGLWGYIGAMDEISRQLNDIDAVFIPVGTGGTYAGLFIGKKMLGLTCDIYGINVEDDSEYFVDEISRVIEEWNGFEGMNITFKREEIKIIDGYQGEGYSIFGREEISLIREICMDDGIILDPVYTSKGMKGLLGEIKKGRFDKNSRVVFIHTGGIFGLLSRLDEIEKIVEIE